MTPREAHEAAVEAATQEVYARFMGGSSGLDDMAEAIARDHAETAIRAYLSALKESGWKLTPTPPTPWPPEEDK